jgi:hypothetical protein
VIPTPGARFGAINAIAAVSARDIWVVGFRYLTNPWPPGSTPHPGRVQKRALIEHWNGTNWRLIPSPFPRHDLQSIAVISSHDLWVSGASFKTDVVSIAHRIGTTWRRVQIPRIKDQSVALLAAHRRNDVWAIADSYSNSSVIEHYSCR